MKLSGHNQRAYRGERLMLVNVTRKMADDPEYTSPWACFTVGDYVAAWMGWREYRRRCPL